MTLEERQPQDWLADIEGAAPRITIYLEGVDFASFAATSQLRDAVLLNFLVIGEAARNDVNLFPDQARRSELPLGSMRMMRNRLIHGYWDADATILWEAARQDLPNVLARPVPLIAVEKGQ